MNRCCDVACNSKEVVSNQRSAISYRSLTETWEVEYTDEFGDWYEALNESEQDSIDRNIYLLEQFGRHFQIGTANLLSLLVSRTCAN
jgi:hypothetical protein